MRNPLDKLHKGPSARGVLTVGAASLVLLAAGSAVVHLRTDAARRAHVQAALAAQGYGDAKVEPIRGDECWRAREGYRWRTAAASGTACAGPGSEVRIYRAERPRL